MTYKLCVEVCDQIVVIKNGLAYRIHVPEGAKIFRADPSLDVDFDLVRLNHEVMLSDHVVRKALSGDKRFRLVDFEPLPGGRCTARAIMC
jgi:hypothetical protein